ncbi:MAG: ElyC/SanA/YdcF family protein [Candidatus Gracilibacteria bacterium]|nr:ElyC/SanA/YdcF family protein [Candidatus Gracilibacteria bacterium]
MKKFLKVIVIRLLKFFIPIIFLALFIIGFINYWVLSFSKDNFFTDVEKLPNIEVGLVFGASVKKSLEPSDILRDRLDVVVSAYEKGKIKKIIVSGDNGMEGYNEPLAMELYLVSKGVEADDVYRDYAGFDTYDSLYRAKHLFGVEEVILFTQDFHLKRAMYIAKRLNYKEVIGIQTNLQDYIAESYNNRREILARVKAFLDLEINNSKPIVLGELIDMNEVQIKD